MRQKTGYRWKLLVACYLAGLLIWLAFCGILLGRDTLRLRDNTLHRLELQAADFTQTSGVRLLDNGDFITTDADPQLIYSREQPFYLNRLVFSGAPLNRGIGEMVLYYATNPDLIFSDGQRLWAQQDESGNWVFDLGGRAVYALRFDPDSLGGVYWYSRGFVLNAPIEPPGYFWPSVQQAALLLLLPLLGWGVLSEVSAWVHPVLARRRFEKKWNQLI